MIVTGTNSLSFFILAGIAIGITGDAGVRATAQQPRMFVGMVTKLKLSPFDRNQSY